MPLIEVEETDFQNSSAAKQLLDKFAANPKLRPKLLGLIKELNPDAAIPEIDAAAPLREELDALRKEVSGTVGELKELLESGRSEEHTSELQSH